MSTCEHITIAPRYGYGAAVPADRNPDELWTCAQRAGHRGPHNRYCPAGGPNSRCQHTAWADCRPELGCATDGRGYAGW